MKIYTIKQTSGQNILEKSDIPTPDPKPDEILIRHEAIGVNFIDYEYLRGSVKSPTNPIIPGCEAVGTIEKLGSDIKNFEVGQRVGYATVLSGAYAEYRCIKPRFLFPIHDAIETEAAALNLLKGMTAHLLMRRTFFLREGMTILIHGGASNLGKLMVRLARELRVKTISTVGSHEKKAIIDDLSGDLALNYNDDNIPYEVTNFTKKKGVHVIYDLIGGALIKDSLKCLMPFGLAVSAGNAHSKAHSINPSLLARKSLFLTSPRIQNYKRDSTELLLSVVEVFGLIEAGAFPKKADITYSFDEIPKALDDVASRDSKSKVILLS